MDLDAIAAGDRYCCLISGVSGQSRRIIGLLLAVLLVLTIGIAGRADASLKFFQLFGRICLVVYDLRETHRPMLRDDYADAIAPGLSEAANSLLKGMRVTSRRECIQPSEAGFEQQLNVELFVKRQEINFEGGSLNSVTVGGSAPNLRGPLAEHQLLPVLILSRLPVDDASVERALTAFVDGTVLALLRSEVTK